MEAVAIAQPLVEHWETFSATPYVCPAGHWTIGFGRLCVQDEPATTLERERAWTSDELERICDRLLQISPVLLSTEAYRLAALASFSYNLGLGRYRASTLRARVNDRAWVAASEEFGKWVWAGGRRLNGLVARRAAEARMFQRRS